MTKTPQIAKTSVLFLVLAAAGVALGSAALAQAPQNPAPRHDAQQQDGLSYTPTLGKEAGGREDRVMSRDDATTGFGGSDFDARFTGEPNGHLRGDRDDQTMDSDGPGAAER